MHCTRKYIHTFIHVYMYTHIHIKISLIYTLHMYVHTVYWITDLATPCDLISISSPFYNQTTVVRLCVRVLQRVRGGQSTTS